MAQVTLNLTSSFLGLRAAIVYLVGRDVSPEQALKAVEQIIRERRVGDLRFPGGTVRFGSAVKWRFGDAWLETAHIDIERSTIVAPGQGWQRTECLPVLIEIAVAALDRLLEQARPIDGRVKVALRPEHDAQYLEHIEEIEKAEGRPPTPDEDKAWAKARGLSRAQWRDNLRRRLLLSRQPRADRAPAPRQ
jgi:hypothetical protein